LSERRGSCASLNDIESRDAISPDTDSPQFTHPLYAAAPADSYRVPCSWRPVSLTCQLFSSCKFIFDFYSPSSHFQLYFSADAVIILNAHTLALIRVLAFWEAFPGTMHSKEKISCLAVDPGMKLVGRPRYMPSFILSIVLIDRRRHEIKTRCVVAFGYSTRYLAHTFYPYTSREP